MPPRISLRSIRATLAKKRPPTEAASMICIGLWQTLWAQTRTRESRKHGTARETFCFDREYG
jgi:hypothetical protein